MWTAVKLKHKEVSDEVLNERRSLIERAQKGDHRAFQAYHNLNAGLFEKIIRQYAHYIPIHEIDAMRQEGMLGLIKGINAYDPTKALKTKPEGYVFSWVRAYVSNFARNHGIAATSDTVSANSTNHDGEEEDLFDQMSSDEESVEFNFACREYGALIKKTLRTLLPTERLIVERRTLADVPETLENIGKELGVSRERIRQIEIEVKEKLRRRYHRGELLG